MPFDWGEFLKYAGEGVGTASRTISSAVTDAAKKKREDEERKLLLERIAGMDAVPEPYRKVAGTFVGSGLGSQAPGVISQGLGEQARLEKEQREAAATAASLKTEEDKAATEFQASQAGFSSFGDRIKTAVTDPKDLAMIEGILAKGSKTAKTKDDFNTLTKEILDIYGAGRQRETKKEDKTGPDSRLANKAVMELQKVDAPLRESMALFSSFNDKYGGFKSNTVGDAAIEFQKRLGDNTDFVDWWQRYQENKNKMRHDLFGSALTATEKTEFEKAVIAPGMTSAQIKKNLERQEITAKIAASKIATFYKNRGVDAETIETFIGNYGQFDWENYVPPDWYLGKKTGAPEGGSTLSPDKAKRLAELRAKKQAGTLQRRK